MLEGPEHLYYVCLSVRPLTLAVSGVRGADEQQKLSSVPDALYVFNNVRSFYMTCYNNLVTEGYIIATRPEENQSYFFFRIVE